MYDRFNKGMVLLMYIIFSIVGILIIAMRFRGT